MEHANRYQVVIDIAASIARIHVNGIQHRDKVLLAQSINVVADNELETAEATGYDLIAFVFQRLTNRNNDNAPAFILDLLTACLNNFLKAFEYGQFI